ncbi:MAG: putative peptidoglycan glycosyltransferase FtsW [Jannaschia helgolandensis]|jgi:cell division protein FtsW|uniref:Probable peptidoglycan glycosyltransferase FtsW n=1 Tax=Jannaschia helgolandensis TaxID=188906 RepID=A0A1H7MX22_9RHOB|nr:putative peptidoglycan glycosyltransferase FtsW [Jannaschia helgolandensis]SEL15852.1 cell division protein FtsW [Jannaschia helgolandensis]|tara:strand:+ start:2353 stop:3522 length:1170 start_codon:yes stop_codon:yes gene_type:complete
MTEIAHGAVVVLPGEAIVSRWWRTIDKGVLGALVLLFAVGLLLGFAASVPLAERNGLPPFYYVYRQAFFGGMAFVVMLGTSMMSPDMVRRLGVIGFFFAAAALMLLPALGTDFGKGATRWYSLGFISLQPSEFLKPVFIIISAWLMASASEPGGPPGRLISFGVLIVVVAFLALQPDFGQAMLTIVAWSGIYFVAGAPILLLTAIGMIVGLVGVVAYKNSEHFARRIDGFLSPDVDPRTQMGYAIDAIREGGFFGTGVNEGRVKWILPDAHTDFIIAVAAEEYGLVMVLFIVALFGFIAVRCLTRLCVERDTFIRLAGAGLTVLLSAQAFINLGVAVRLLPAKGMTLPFVSYGGSSLIAMGALTGMLLCFTRTRPQAEIGDHLLSNGYR